MIKLKLNLPEVKSIEINGKVFEIKKSDIDILNKSREFTEKYGNIKENDQSNENIKLITKGANEIIAYIDEILGKGAVSKISEGRAINISTACEWLTSICKAIAQDINTYVTETYE